MATQGPNSPGTLADETSVGTVAWSNPTNAAASDNSRASATAIGGATTHYLHCSNFGFSIPLTATIDGITVGIERRDSFEVAYFQEVRVIKSLASVGSNLADPSLFPPADAYATYGDGLEKWGLTWTAAEINATDFGVLISVLLDSPESTAEIDHVRVTVAYTAAAPGPLPPRPQSRRVGNLRRM